MNRLHTILDPLHTIPHPPRRRVVRGARYLAKAGRSRPVRTLVALLALTAAVPTLAVAQDRTQERDATQLLQEAQVFGEAPYARVTASLDIRRESRSQSRTVEILYADAGDGGRNVFARVTKPPFLSQMRFLLRQTPDGETEQWLATSRGVRRLTGTGSHDGLFSSDFTVEELSGFPGSDYQAEYIGTEEVDGYDTTVLRGSVDHAKSVYDTFVLRLDNETGIIVWIEFFRQDKLTKEYRLLEMGSADGTPYTKRCRMETYVEDSTTELTVEEIAFPDSLPDETFRPDKLE